MSSYNVDQDDFLSCLYRRHQLGRIVQILPKRSFQININLVGVIVDILDIDVHYECKISLCRLFVDIIAHDIPPIILVIHFAMPLQ